MHKTTVDGLEDYLDGRLTTTASERLVSHIGVCAECRVVVEAMQGQSVQIRVLRTEAEPAPGFYARVRDRIEARAVNSFWAMLLEPFVMRRMMYASLALLVVLCSAAVTAHSSRQLLEAVPAEIVAEMAQPIAENWGGGDQREVVFVNLASYSGSGFDLLPVSNE